MRCVNPRHAGRPDDSQHARRHRLLSPVLRSHAVCVISSFRENFLKELQPPDADHQAAGRSRASCTGCGLSAAVGVGARIVTELFGFWLLVHTGLYSEASLAASSVQRAFKPLASMAKYRSF